MNTRINLQEAFKFALSMVLMYWLALLMDWDLAKYGALAILLMSLSTSGASINKGVMRVIGTLIGCVVAIILMEWFSQARWSMMIVLAGYLVFISYFLQTSRYPYAWYVAGFVPLVIWSDTYGGAFDNTFHFSIFRLLETSAGVLIYSLVSVLLWPQTAGNQFYRQGGEYLDNLCHLLRLYRNAKGDQESISEAQKLRWKLYALSTPLQKTLEAALSDTMVIREYQREWVLALATLRTLTDSLSLWRDANEACLQIVQEQGQPNMKHALHMIEQRCTRISELWRAKQLPGEVTADNDTPLLQVLSLDQSIPHTLTNAERGLLLNRADQLQRLDQTSLELLITLRVLAGLDSAAGLSGRSEPLTSDRPPRWDSERLVKSLIPALTFIIGFLFWIYPSDPPPAGQAIAMMCGIFGLMVVLGANVRYLGLLFAVSGLFIIAPIYFIVMPWLDGGVGLLSMIFILSFTTGYLGGRWPMVKTSVMLLFVMTTSISNNQSYSFMSWVGLEFVMIMAGLIVSVVVMFMVPVRPEKILLHRVSRFFHACAKITGGFASGSGKNREKQQYLREVRMTPGQLLTVVQTLDYNQFPTNSPDKVNHLLGSVESTASRMQVLITLMERVSATGSTAPLGTEFPYRLQQLFEHWAKLSMTTGVTEEERRMIVSLYYELEQRLDAYKTETETTSYCEQKAIDLTALLGGVRGLLDVMVEMDQAIHEIRWDQWAEARL